ncbi:MAG: hypothetical protein K6B72_02860 [Lachnospiraceae bacterium]|nr:hypothetical protein [Lachnospiraceae bacterium]
MKMTRVMAVALAGTLLFSVPVFAADSKTASDTAAQAAPASAEEVIANAAGTTVQALEAQVNAGEYVSVMDALYGGNITEPADVKEPGQTSAWVSTIAEKEMIIGGVKKKITSGPRSLTQTKRKAAKAAANAAGKSLLNCGKLFLKNTLDSNKGQDITYPLLLNGGKFTPQPGDCLHLYNTTTGQWDEFPATFREGHCDINIAAGTDMSPYINASGDIQYFAARNK